MQKIRGHVYFKNKTLEHIKSIFRNIKLDNLSVVFFKEFDRTGEQILMPGIFVSGEIAKKYSSKDLIVMAKQLMNSDEGIQHADVSIENEDYFNHIKQGETSGNYIGLRIKPPFKSDVFEQVAIQIGDVIQAHDILIRGVQDIREGGLTCIDLLTKNQYKDYQSEIEKILANAGLTLHQYTIIPLLSS